MLDLHHGGKGPWWKLAKPCNVWRKPRWGGGGLKNNDNNKILWVSCYCWWFRNPANQLRLVVFSVIYKGCFKSQVVVWDFWTINSIMLVTLHLLAVYFCEWMNSRGSNKIEVIDFLFCKSGGEWLQKKHIHGRTNSVICLCLWILSFWTKFRLTTWGWLYRL